MARFDENSFKYDKVPTLRQAIKMNQVSAKRYVVNTVWLPGKFKMVTLETDTFRFNVAEGSDLFEAVMEEVQSCVMTNTTLFVDISSVSPLEMETLTHSEEKCEWSELGQTGYRAEKFKRVKTKRDPKTPVAK